MSKRRKVSGLPKIPGPILTVVRISGLLGAAWILLNWKSAGQIQAENAGSSQQNANNVDSMMQDQLNQYNI